MTVKQMWRAFLKVAPEAALQELEAWCYSGKDADQLAELTVRGIKTATSSAYPMYIATGEPLPRANSYSVLTGSDGEAVCVLYTSKVYVVPFCDVTEEHAWREGEGDRSLACWRNVHKAVFTAALAEAGLPFSDDMGVVCEEFSRVFPVLS